MDASEYHRQCQRPDAFPRDVLERCVHWLRDRDPKSANLLENALSSSPIQKPAEHQGGAESDYFLVRMDPASLDVLIHSLFEAEAEAAAAESPAAGQIADLVDSWSRLHDPPSSR